MEHTDHSLKPVGSTYVMLGSSFTPSMSLRSLDLLRPSPDSPVSVYELKGPGLLSVTQGNLRSIAVIDDVNGDRRRDILIGSPLQGKAHLLFGNPQHNLQGLRHGTVIFGDGDGSGVDYFGWAVSSAGDFNGDGLGDFMVSAVLSGKVYLFYGRYSFPAMMDVTKWSYGKDGFVILPASGTVTSTGVSLSCVGDFNGDGLSDIAITSVTTDQSSIVFVVFGIKGRLVSSFSLKSFNKYSLDGVRLVGSQGSFIGISLAGAGDINGDSFDDLVVGSLPYQNGYTQQRAYLVYGRNLTTTPTTTIALSSLSDSGVEGFEIFGGGFFVSGIGDVNRDGHSDFLVTGFDDWKGRNGIYLMVSPSDFTAFPTSQPSGRPSASPTTFNGTIYTENPSLVPSEPPTTWRLSLAPSGSTRSPSMAPSGPTVYPTFVSTPVPSSARPSQQPQTRKPVRKPYSRTLSPTLTKPTPLPSVDPSRRPSRIPTASPSTRRPTAFVAPSSWPTVSLDDFVITYIEGSGLFYGSDTARKEKLLIHPDNYTKVYSQAQVRYYRFLPVKRKAKERTTLILCEYNPRLDYLDFSAYPSITSLENLQYTEPPVTFYLPDGVEISCESVGSFSPLNLQNIVFSSGSSVPDSSPTSTMSITPGSWMGGLSTSVLITLIVVAVLLGATLLLLRFDLLRNLLVAVGLVDKNYIEANRKKKMEEQKWQANRRQQLQQSDQTLLPALSPVSSSRPIAKLHDQIPPLLVSVGEEGYQDIINLPSEIELSTQPDEEQVVAAQGSDDDSDIISLWIWDDESDVADLVEEDYELNDIRHDLSSSSSYSFSSQSSLVESQMHSDLSLVSESRSVSAPLLAPNLLRSADTVSSQSLPFSESSGESYLFF
jgi:hypothetical protein